MGGRLALLYLEGGGVPAEEEEERGESDIFTSVSVSPTLWLKLPVGAVRRLCTGTAALVSGPVTA